MHTGLSEEQRRQIEKMRRQSGRMPVYRKNRRTSTKREFFFYTPSGGNAAAGTVFAVSFERQFDLWI